MATLRVAVYVRKFAAIAFGSMLRLSRTHSHIICCWQHVAATNKIHF